MHPTTVPLLADDHTAGLLREAERERVGRSARRTDVRTIRALADFAGEDRRSDAGGLVRLLADIVAPRRWRRRANLESALTAWPRLPRRRTSRPEDLAW